MFCPQCATESQPDNRFCRKCGANLGLIFKAVKVTEAIARGDGAGSEQLKTMLGSAAMNPALRKELAEGIGQLKTEIKAGIASAGAREMRKKSGEHRARRASRNAKASMSREERREQWISCGIRSMFTGLGLSLFLYLVVNAVLATTNVGERLPMLGVAWTIGLVPAFAGLGHLIAGLLLRPDPQPRPALDELAGAILLEDAPRGSVTESDTALLDPSGSATPLTSTAPGMDTARVGRRARSGG